jgi:hypothetical protein
MLFVSCMARCFSFCIRQIPGLISFSEMRYNEISWRIQVTHSRKSCHIYVTIHNIRLFRRPCIVEVHRSVCFRKLGT